MLLFITFLFTPVDNLVDKSVFSNTLERTEAMNNPNYLATVWGQALDILEQEIARPIFNTWIKSSIPLAINNNVFELGTPTELSKHWIETRYLGKIEAAVLKVTNQPLEVRFIILDIPDPVSTATDNADIASPLNLPIEQASPFNEKASSNMQNVNTNKKFSPAFESAPSPLNPKYVFETFVIGNSNRFAHAASLAVAEDPAKVYNPLFLYGGVGLGKTHLMHAIGHRIRQHHPNAKVLYISSEKFTNELINSIRDGNPESFRKKYRNIDVLLVDDIQFLSKKEHTQEEFFHTFNTLHEANKQIILSSDRPPREIPTLEDRLRSRFEWGLITDIQAPDLETRIAILRKKAMLETLDIPNEVMVFIATRIDNNIRELEGALIRVMAYASLTKLPITLDLATEALKDILPNGKPKRITIDSIKEVVSTYFKIKLDDLSAKKRTRNVTYPRQIAMYLCRELTDSSLPKIGEEFGGRDHTTVIHAHDKILRELNEDNRMQNTLAELIRRIEGA